MFNPCSPVLEIADGLSAMRRDRRPLLRALLEYDVRDTPGSLIRFAVGVGAGAGGGGGFGGDGGFGLLKHIVNQFIQELRQFWIVRQTFLSTNLPPDHDLLPSKSPVQSPLVLDTYRENGRRAPLKES